jgi:23S rRNA pseudouridine1911/1915/1917 synthase
MIAGARKFHTAALDAGRPLASFVAERLGVPTADADALVRAGAVYIGARRVSDPDAALGAGARVTVHVDAVAAADPGEIRVIHEDDEVVAIDKPAGVPTQATRERASSALDHRVRQRYPDARLVHRLDRDASGLVLFTRGPAAQGRFAAMLRGHEIERWYRAVVSGHVAEDAGLLDRAIGRDPQDRRRMAAGVGRPAATRFSVERRGHTEGGAPTTLVSLELVTGRTHQIRVHMADAGHPLCGDPRYGRPAPPVARMCLHAVRLRWPRLAGWIESPAPALFDELVGVAQR